MRLVRSFGVGIEEDEPWPTAAEAFRDGWQEVQAGELPKTLDSAADAHARSMQLKIAVMTGLAEPLLILLMSAVVLVIMLAILLPIFDMNRLV